MVIYSPRRSTERLQELIVDLSTTSKKKTSETLDRGSKVYQQSQNAIKREFQGVQEAINTLQTNHNAVTKNRADIIHAHQKDNEYIQQLLDSNYKKEIKNIEARAQTELKNTESWRKIIGVGAGYALQQAQKEKDRLTKQNQGLAVDLDVSTPKKFAGLDTYLTELTKNKNKDKEILEKANWSPENIERVVKLTPRELVNLRKAAAIYTGKSVVGSIEKQYRKPIHQLPEGGDPVSYYTLKTYVTSSKYRTVEGHDQAASILNNAHNTIVKHLREQYKGKVSLKLFDEHIAPQLRTHWQKEIPGVLKPLLRNVEAQARERDFEANFPAQWDTLSKLEGLNVPKTLGKMFEDWMLTKPDNISAEEWNMRYTDRIIGFGVRSGKVSRHQARMYSYHEIFDKTDQTRKPWRKKFKKAAIALEEIIRTGALQAQQISNAEGGNKRNAEQSLVTEGIERLTDRMLEQGTDVFNFTDVQLQLNEMTRGNNYPPEVVAKLKQHFYLGPSSAPMIAGQEFKQTALSIINNPNRKLTFDWILDNGKHVPPTIKNQVIELWRKNGGNGPKEGVRGYHQVKKAHKTLENKFKSLGGARWKTDKYIDYSVADGETHARQKYDEDLLDAWTNNGGNWVDAHNTAYKNFRDELAKGEESIYHVETDTKGRKWMPYFADKVAAAKESEDHLGDYAALYKEKGIGTMQSPEFEPIDANTLNKMAYQWNNGLPMTWPPILDKLKRHLPGVYENEGQILAELVIGHNARNPIDVSTTPQITLNKNTRFDELNAARQGVESTVTTPAAPTNSTITESNLKLGGNWSIENIYALNNLTNLAPWMEDAIEILGDFRVPEDSLA